jgi:hypothetical protein
MGDRTNARRAHNLRVNGSRAHLVKPRRGTGGYSDRTAVRKIAKILSRNR